MDRNVEGTVSVLAALLVLFSAMFEPVVSVVLAAAFLIFLAAHSFLQARRKA
jgi:hypothetical protein